jgi:hypothetical protein
LSLFCCPRSSRLFLDLPEAFRQLLPQRVETRIGLFSMVQRCKSGFVSALLKSASRFSKHVFEQLSTASRLQQRGDLFPQGARIGIQWVESERFLNRDERCVQL